MSTGRAAVFFGPGKPFEIRDVPLPEVEPDAVLIRVSLCQRLWIRSALLAWRRPASSTGGRVDLWP